LFSNMQYLALLLIPIIAAATTYISIKLSTPKAAASSANQMQGSMTKSMLMIMPAMIAFFSFSVPAGLGLYWIVGNIIQIFQQLFVNKYVIKKKEVAKT